MKKLILVILVGVLVAGFAVNKLISEPSVDSNTLATSLNEFNFDFYRNISQPNANIISSPYSLSSLLSLTAQGAAGDTRVQLMHVLHINNLTGLGQALDKINDAWLNTGTASFANALWGAKNLTYNESFLLTMRESKYNHFLTVDYAKDPEVARQSINNWVEQNTQNYIKDLLPMNSLTKDTRLVLVNAIYFKGLWQVPFENTMTKQGSFTLMNGKTIQTPMMNQQEHFLYSENDSLRMLQLPYNKGNLMMAILLPKNSLLEVLKKINGAQFSDLLSSASRENVVVQLPKFKIESTFDSLTETLQGMGLVLPFQEKADFSNMVKGPLWFSKVVQKAVLEVDEKGTVASAASGMVGVTAVAPGVPNIIEFIVDRPFLFVIFDAQAKIVLFMGQVVSF